SVSEDGTLTTSGNLLANDSDIDNGTALAVANAGTYVGTYGTLTLNADGSYSYSLNNGSSAVQSLRQGQSVSDVFAYLATDGLAQTSGSLSVGVAGVNDAPVGLAGRAALSEGGSVFRPGRVATHGDEDGGSPCRATA